MKIFIIGHRSVGKTTVGKIIAKKLKIKFIDFDSVVSKKLGNLRTYGKKYGSEKYRTEERKILMNFLKRTPSKIVVSLGGGTVASQYAEISKANTKDVSKIGTFVYLIPSKSQKETIDTIHERELRRKGDKNKEETIKLVKLRTPVFNKIKSIKILTARRKVSEITEDILKKLK